MRFIAGLVEDYSVAPSTAATYFGQVQGWHAREYGVKLAGGMKLGRVSAMVKGLRRLHGGEGREVRRGVSPQALREAMDKCLDPNVVEHANMRAALALGFQGLLRGAEFAVNGRWTSSNMARGDRESRIYQTDDRMHADLKAYKEMEMKVAVPDPEFKCGQSVLQWWAGWMKSAEETPQSWNSIENTKTVATRPGSPFSGISPAKRSR